MKTTSFLHCLRAQIYPDEYADERINSITQFCLRYGIQNVILIFNGEEFNVGHITKEELKPWMDVMKQAKKRFLEAGLTFSLNPWMEIGHVDRGRTLQPGQHFQTMVDRNGKACTMVACPSDPEWKKYYLDLLAYYVKELEPDVLWIEDDFRLHNHDPLDWGGCFCPIHMEQFSKALGKVESRETFVKNLSAREPSPERAAWLDVSWKTMDGLAKDIAKTVASLGVKTHIGLMSSTPWQHAMEARDWATLHQDLCYDGVKIDRIHLPAYREMGSKAYYFDFNRISVVNRSFIGDDCAIYPELENSSYCLFSKDAKFVQFQVEGALPLGLSGMTYNIFESTGNGAQEQFHYGEAIQDITPYLNAVMGLHLLPSQMRGLIFPLDEHTVYHRHKEGFLSLIPTDFDPVGYFSSLGYSYQVSKNKSFLGQTIVLTGDNVWNFSEEELKRLFAENFVIVDGGAVLALQERGLLSLIHAVSASNEGQCRMHATLEMGEEGPYHNFHHYRVCAQRRAGDYVQIKYDKDVSVASGLYDPRMNRNGNGVAYDGNHFYVYPYIVQGNDDTAFFFSLRVGLWEKHMLSQVKTPIAYSANEGVYAYLYEQRNRYVLFFTNANYSRFENVSFMLRNVPFTSITWIKRDGTEEKIPFHQENDSITLDIPFEPLSTATFVLE